VFSGFVGLAAYMDRGALNLLAREGHVLSAILVREHPSHALELQEELRRMPAVASVLGKRAMVEEFRAVIARNIVQITLLHAAFAGVIAFGVVYNTARIAFAERRREFATLRVLGFTRAEVGKLLFTEIALLTLVGVPAGLVIGQWLARWLLAALATESYELPLVISARTYSFAALVTVLAAACSAALVRRGIARLDLLSTLKEAG
jgi:putative ABC transport system permease protein